MNSPEPFGLAVVGCGDFLRWQAPSLRASGRIRVRWCFDLEPTRARQGVALVGGEATDRLDDILGDPQVSAVALFVPPAVRAEVFERIVAAGKHVLTTKPLGPDAASCARIRAAVGRTGVRAGVIYGRTGDAFVNALKAMLDGGEFGRLALYKQDWVHHHPTWNTWALDPARNGGPFMDAMIHNLNAACFLMGRPPRAATFLRDNHAHAHLAVADTEFLKLDFDGPASAHLLITWAADLAVDSHEGNDREHLDHRFLVTDRGWHLSAATERGRPAIRATRLGEVRLLPVPRTATTSYDAFAVAVVTGTPLPPDLVDLPVASAEIALLRRLEAAEGRRVAVDWGELAG